MKSTLTSIERCAEISGLRGSEIVLGVSPDARHERMLLRYRRVVSQDVARAQLVAEIRESLNLGSPSRAADLLIVLRRLLAEGAGFCAARAPTAARRRGEPARARRGATTVPPASPARMAAVEGATVLPWRGAPRIPPRSL